MIISKLIALLITTVVASATMLTPPTDAEATKLLVGNWIIPPEECTDVCRGGGFTFKPDNSLSFYAVFHIVDKDVRIDIQGVWRVKDGVLIEEITHSSDPRWAPIGHVTRDRLLAVTANEFRFVTEEGEEHWRQRK